MSVFDNLPSDHELTEPALSGGEIKDPNNSSYPNRNAGGAAQNKFSVDLSGPSGQMQGSSFDQSIPSMKDRMPTPAPGNGSGALTDNNGTGNSSGIPAAVPVEPILFGDPNDTAVDYKDGYSETGSDKTGNQFTGIR